MPKLTVNITDKDSGYDKFAATLESFKKKAVDVGIQSNEDSQLLTIANVQEFGAEITVTPKMRAFFRGAFKINLKKTTNMIIIPSRPFIRQTFSKREKELLKIGFALARAVIDDKLTVKQALENWGDQGVAFIRSEVADGNNFAPNAPLTIRQKGVGKHPLQDSGRLMQALKAVLVEK